MMKYLKIPVDDDYEIGDCDLCPFGEYSFENGDICLIGEIDHCKLNEWDYVCIEEKKINCEKTFHNCGNCMLYGKEIQKCSLNDAYFDVVNITPKTIELGCPYWKEKK